MDEFLKIFEPVDRFLQSQNIGYNRAMPKIQILQSTTPDYRNDNHFTKYKRIADELCPMYSDTNRARNRRRSTLLNEFVVDSTIGESSNEDDDAKATYFEIIDVINEGIRDRFSENSDILLAMSNVDEMDMKDVKQFETLGLKIPEEHELLTAKKYIEKKNFQIELQVPVRMTMCLNSIFWVNFMKCV